MRREWAFARRPGWIFSHLFAATLIIAFIAAGFWQLGRLSERRQSNAVIEARSTAAPVPVGEALTRDPSELDFVPVLAEGHYVDPEAVRVANRSHNGLGGDWVVGLFETNDGHLILVNRGFAGREEAAVAPDVSIPLTGWMRESQVKTGFLGAADDGASERVPRLDVEAIGGRLGLDESRLAPLWLQQSGDEVGVAPYPVPLPAISEGNHFSYAVQWFTFAVLSVVVYSLMLRRISAGNQDS